MNPFKLTKPLIRASATLSLIAVSLLTSAQVKMTEEDWKLPTYEVLPDEKAPQFFTNDKYQGASRYIYPYTMNDMISPTKVMKDWKALRLENEYIELCVTPEIGGKLYYAKDKTTDYNFIYKNNEVKPGNLGMTGAWVSGGIEWCMFHHHRASTFREMDYRLVEGENGKKTIYFGEIEPRHGMRWTIGISMYPGKSYFEAEIAAYNPTALTNSFLFWANVAAHTNKDFQTIFPPSVNQVTYHSKTEFSDWPIAHGTYLKTDYSEGVDISYWKNVKRSGSFFAHDLKEDFMGSYDHGQHTGTVHVGDHNIVKGAKLWEWGSGERGQNTEARLTETSGPYVEIMVGAFSDNQPDYSWIRPGEVKRWKQYWYPVRDIKGFKNANLNGAVNLERVDQNKIFLGYYSTEKRENAKVIVRNGKEVLFERSIDISPEKTFTHNISIDPSLKDTDLTTELIDDRTGDVLICYTPREHIYTEHPETVGTPKRPEEIDNIEELFLTGSRIEQFYNPRFDEKDYYDEILRRDPKDMRTNLKLGNLAIKNYDFEKAHSYLNTAIQRFTRDHTRPDNCEALYLQGVVLKEMERYEDARDTLYRATWDYSVRSAAYFQLAQISCKKGEMSKALEEIDACLETNAIDTRAISLKVAILRHLKREDEALRIAEVTLKKDPLNFRLLYEQQLMNGAKDNKAWLNTMRAQAQNYIHLAEGYYNEGLYTEVQDILTNAPQADPIVNYYQGATASLLGNGQMASRSFEKASELPIDRCFPFRSTTIKVLEIALDHFPTDANAHYYLGNIYYDKRPAHAIDQWEKAVALRSDHAMATRNLGWGYYRHENDIPKAIEAYEKAIELDNDQAIYYAELDKLYEMNNTPIAKRMSLFENKNEVAELRDDAIVQEVTVLTLGGRPDLSVKYLDGRKFSYREGNSGARESIIDAHLCYGIQLMEKNENEAALEQFLAAQIPDEEAGSARYGNRDLQVNYFIAKAYKSLGKKAKAKEYFKKVTAGKFNDRIGAMDHYLGASYMELKMKKEAKQVFQQLIEEGEKMLANREERSDFFDIFGEKEKIEFKRSRAHTLIGLGAKGLGDVTKANEHLKKAIDLQRGNLWARTELKEMNGQMAASPIE